MNKLIFITFHFVSVLWFLLETEGLPRDGLPIPFSRGAGSRAHVCDFISCFK